MIQTISWGIKPPPDVQAAWGARAIFEGGAKIELVPDRQAAAGTPKDIKHLLSWVNRTGLPKLRQALRMSSLRKDDNREVRILVNTEKRTYTIVANPRASYGYLYIGIWFTNNEVAK